MKNPNLRNPSLAQNKENSLMTATASLVGVTGGDRDKATLSRTKGSTSHILASLYNNPLLALSQSKAVVQAYNDDFMPLKVGTNPYSLQNKVDSLSPSLGYPAPVVYPDDEEEREERTNVISMRRK
jgi:hypothetical protein